MANKLRPWIVEYLLDVGKQYGAQIYKAPIIQKPRAIQLVQFLTYPSDSQPLFVWAIASDKSHKLPIKLTAEAMKEYQTAHPGRRLSKQRTVIVSIKSFQPIFCRVPTANQGMSKHACLALLCHGFSALGSYGEACFGEPMSIDDVEDLKIWSEGLRQDGGAGNVLQNRNRELQTPSNEMQTQSYDFESSYKISWKCYNNAFLAHPCEDVREKFENLELYTKPSSPEHVVSDWELTPVRAQSPERSVGRFSVLEKRPVVLAFAIVLTMTVSVAGFGHPFLRLFALLSSKGDVRSILCFLSFCIVLLVLAYLTNPSESSFRAYLTELSFRHHLSRLDRLDDGIGDSFHDVSTPPSLCDQPSSFTLTIDKPPLLHFATRASVSLRTPKHVFHSFGVFTVATMLPTAKSSDRNNSVFPSIITDSWYVGAFGKWWRGGIVEAWYKDVVARSKDEESWTSGILSLSTDVRHECSGLPLSRGPIQLNRGSPPRLRNREKSSQRLDSSPPCSTPPPLPKSALLPLHASHSQRNCIGRSPSLHVPQSLQINPSLSSEQSSLAVISSDSSPPIADLLRQISLSKTTLLDLQTQLSECQTASSQSRAHLQSKIDDYRERRRREDVVKMELKSRTKFLDDSKRQAESLKREAEKKLKTVQSTQNNAIHSLTLLDERVTRLQDQIACDHGVIGRRSIQQSGHVLADELEHRRYQVKLTEEKMAHSSQRARELENRLNRERERLATLRHRLGSRKGVVQRSVDDQHARSWSDPSVSLMDVLECAAPRRSEQSRGLESPIDLLKAASTLDKHSFIDSKKSPALSYNEATFPDAFSRSAPYLTDHSPLFSLSCDNNTSFQPLAHSCSAVSDHVSKNAPCLTEGFAHHGRGIIPADAPVDDGFNAEHELLPTGSCSRTSLLPQVEWETRLGQECVMTGAGLEGIVQHDWFPFDFDENSRKRLNPDAKEFSLGRNSTPYFANPDLESRSGYDALDSHGLRTSTTSSATTYCPSVLRAFAPSAAERQVLRRALGATSNASFERLPSLGDVGSIPIPPPPTNATSTEPQILSRVYPSWLVPQNYKVNFSPWDDEEQDQHGSTQSAGGST
ncbi:hypothetical protein APHAL10511_000063 [Amanita phalloides]|nr:hypothetical protein APHAL10511_000063 [Amanita phalloides]